jgi:HK97 gp10 family phage protein
MAADGVTVKIAGIDALKRSLEALPDKLRRKALLKPMKAAMKVVLDAARAEVPVLQSPVPYRTSGLLKKRLTVRTSRVSRQEGNVGVFVNVRPAAGAKYKTVGGKRVKKKDSQRGATSKLDPYYWRFVEFGTRKMGKRPFLVPASNKLPAVLAAFEREVIPAIEALNQPGA